MLVLHSQIKSINHSNRTVTYLQMWLVLLHNNSYVILEGTQALSAVILEGTQALSVENKFLRKFCNVVSIFHDNS